MFNDAGTRLYAWNTATRGVDRDFYVESHKNGELRDR